MQVCQEEAGGGGQDQEDQPDAHRHGRHLRGLLVPHRSHQHPGRLPSSRSGGTCLLASWEIFKIFIPLPLFW